MYYYYHYGTPSSKVTITLQLDKAEDMLSLEELLHFLDIVNRLHQYVIFVSQPEYKTKNKDLNTIEDASLLSYHQLDIKKISQNSPIVLELVFWLSSGGLNSYHLAWELLIKFCKRYGENTNKLEKTLEDIFSVFYWHSFKSKSMSLKDLEKYKDDSTSSKIKEMIITLITNPEFRKYYNLMCTTAITITEFTSLITEAGGTEKVIKYIAKDIEETEK